MTTREPLTLKPHLESPDPQEQPGTSSQPLAINTTSELRYTLSAFSTLLPADGTRSHHSASSSRWDRRAVFCIILDTCVRLQAKSAPLDSGLDLISPVLSTLCLACQILSNARDSTRENYRTSRSEETRWWETVIRRSVNQLRRDWKLNELGWNYADDLSKEEYGSHEVLLTDGEHEVKAFSSAEHTISPAEVGNLRQFHSDWHIWRKKLAQQARVKGQDQKEGERAWVQELRDWKCLASFEAMELVERDLARLIEDSIE